jgi:predicted small secreted protein
MSLATATDGSHGFKISIRKLTIALFVLGGLIAAIAIYQQFLIEAKPYAISHQDAVRIALVQVDKEPNRDEVFLPNEKAMARLVHVTDNGMGFVADEDSLVDMWLYSKENRFLSIYENMYLWEVQVSTTDNEGGGRGYSYVIDATTGQVIGDDRDYSYFESS